MFRFSWIRKLFGRTPRSVRKAPARFRPGLEALEDRLAPSSAALVSPGLSWPGNLTNVNGTLFFDAFSSTHGTELRKSDGTADGTMLVKDIHPGIWGSSLESLTNVNGTLFFILNDPTYGQQLWKSDGTDAGTVQVKSMQALFFASSPRQLTSANGMLFFIATTDSFGDELYRSDGTDAGTFRITAISGVSSLTEVNGTLLFRGKDGTYGDELWKSDGTAAGTVRVKDIWPGENGSLPYDLTNVNGTLLFAATDPQYGTELWKSDGTEAGTVLVKDIRPGSANVSKLTNVNGTLFFAADDGTHGRELWKSDGTEAGTVLVKDIHPGSQGSNLDSFTNVNGTLFFIVNDPTRGHELWKSDGTSDGTVFLTGLRTSQGTLAYELTATNGTLFFRNTDDAHGEEVWESDGTEAGTVLVKDIRSGPESSHPRELTDVNGTLFFRALDNSGRERLWRSNQSPTDIALSNSNVTEEQPSGTVIGILSSTDRDSYDIHSYAFVSGNGGTDNALFDIAGNQLQTAVSFDFETKSSYSIRIRGTDAGGLFIEKVFTITVGNLPEIALSNASVAENQPADTLVGTLNIEGDQNHEFVLVSGAGDADNASFQVIGNELRTATSFDFEAKSSYSIRVRSTDADAKSPARTFTILVRDVMDQPPTDIALSNIYFVENQPIGTLVGAFSTADADNGDRHIYTLVSGAGDDDNASFTIDARGNLLTAATFDYEAGREIYSVRVRSMDTVGLFIDKSFLLLIWNENDAPTDITLDNSSVAENAPFYWRVGAFSTADQDYAYDDFFYELVSGSGDDDNASFFLDWHLLWKQGGFDFETKSAYSIRVRSTDLGGLSVEKVLTISVTNVNEAPTDIALSNQSVSENLPAGTVVGSFMTDDPDHGDSHTYTLVGGDMDKFSIDGALLKTAEAFDFGSKAEYSVRVRSTDAGGLSFEKVFTINVIEVNSAPTLTVPGAQLAFEDVDNAISGITVGDPDGDTLTVTLSVTHGTLTLGSTAGLTVTGNGGAVVVLSGTIANLNAALASLLYRGTLNYSGADSLSISVGDGSFTATSSVAISIQSALEQAADLQAGVNALKAAGVLNYGQANSLLVKLNLKGNAGDIGKVQSLIGQINAFAQAGILTQAQAEALLGPANILLLSVARR